MAQFDLYRLDGSLVMDVQANLLDRLNTRIVVPLVPETEAPRPAVRLNPILVIEGTRYVLLPQFMAAVPLADLGAKAGSLAAERDRIKPAVDMVFDGV
jgi:toxin CcdB